MDTEQTDAIMRCAGCGRQLLEPHKMCPAHGTPFYMSKVEFTEQDEKLAKEGWYSSKISPCNMANHGNAMGCSASVHSCIVTSPALRYVVGNGIALGYYKCNNGGTGTGAGKWFILHKGKYIEHEITHWRKLPQSPEEAKLPYEQVKDIAEALRAIE